MSINPVSTYDQELKSQFIELSERLAAIAAKDGLKLTPYIDPELPHFSRLTPFAKKQVLQTLADACRLCVELQGQGFQVRDARALTWKMIQHLGVSPTSDSLGLIEKNDIVEIYSTDNKLLFASLTFFEEVSYGLEDIYCRPWMDLFWRDPATNDALIERIQKILTGQEQGTVRVDLPGYYIEETQSPGKKAWFIQNKYFTPVFEKNEIVGFMCITLPLAHTVRRVPTSLG